MLKGPNGEKHPQRDLALVTLRSRADLQLLAFNAMQAGDKQLRNGQAFEAVEDAFGADVGYAQLLKLYAATIGAPSRYSPTQCTSTKKIRREGNIDFALFSPSCVERHNITLVCRCGDLSVSPTSF